MTASELKTLAGALAEAGAPGLPTVLLTQEVPIFEVEFAALEFAEETKLSSSDWAALALARALGTLSPADVDAYLGLGETVSEGLVRRLVEAALFEEDSDGRSAAPPPVEESGLGGFFRRLLGLHRAPVETAAPRGRVQTVARKLRESPASTSPVCRLSTGGAQALERCAVAQRRVRPARLLFVAEPLLFLGVVDEKHQRHTQHRRPHPLEPERVPDALQTLDAAFALPASERLAACGIESGIRGLPGQFVGIMPGAQWEVRPLEHRSEGKGEARKALWLLAAFPSSEVEGLHWRAYLRRNEQTQDCPHVDVSSILRAKLPSLLELIQAIQADGPVPGADALRRDGAFELRCDGARLPGLLGEADRPSDTFLPARAYGWSVGLRAHAVPSNAEAGRAAFYALLRRRDAALRRDFDGTCADVVTSLTTYWAHDPGLPSAGEAAVHLWNRPELRAALCMRRRHHDLVVPYESRRSER